MGAESGDRRQVKDDTQENSGVGEDFNPTNRANSVVSDLSTTKIMADSPTLSVTMLGAGQEVGRSCCVLQYRGKTVVCDAGVHPAHTGFASLPFVDELDWSTVDAILITQ